MSTEATERFQALVWSYEVSARTAEDPALVLYNLTCLNALAMAAEVFGRPDLAQRARDIVLSFKITPKEQT